MNGFWVFLIVMLVVGILLAIVGFFIKKRNFNKRYSVGEGISKRTIA
jgi:uncharacterized protein YneF (UPF0154 family)